MRGVAALAAAGAVWVLVTGRVPAFGSITFSPPRARILFAGILTGAAGTVLALGLLDVPAAAIAIGVIVGMVPVGIDASRIRKRRADVADAWPDVLAHMRSRISAGETLPAAFVDAARSAGGPLAEAAAQVEDAVAFGDGFGAAIGRVRSDLADPTADRVLTTIEMAHRSGGRAVGRILTALAASVGDELRLRKAHHAAMTEQRMTAAVALVAPWLLLALTVSTNPQAAAAYRSSAGAVVIAVGLVATGAGFVLSRRAAALSTMPRVFR